MKATYGTKAFGIKGIFLEDTEKRHEKENSLMLFVRLFCILFVCWGEMLGIVFVFVCVTLFEVFGWWGFCVKMGVSGTCEWWRGSWGKRDGMTYWRGMRKCLRGMYTNTGWNVACKNNNVYLYLRYLYYIPSDSIRDLFIPWLEVT